MSTKELRFGRRDFLKGIALGGTAIAGVGLLSACDSTANADPNTVTETWDEEVDILVAGSGVGLQAAGWAKEKDPDLDVLVVEAYDKIGGFVEISGGSLSGAETKLQARFGVEDSVDNFVNFMTHYRSVDPELARVGAARSAEVVDWTEDDLGCDFEGCLLIGGEHLPEAVPRSGTTPKRGARLVEKLVEYCEDNQVEIRLNTKLIDLVADKGEVHGAIVTQDGAEKRIKARRGVILATGYFAGSKELMTFYSPQSPESILGFNDDINDGTALIAAQALGAQCASFQLNAASGLAATMSPENLRPLVTMYSSLKGDRICVCVNAEGKRFGNETANNFVENVAQQTNGKVWVIIDERRRVEDTGYYAAWPGCSDSFADEMAAGHIIKGETIAELARNAGLPEAELVATLDRYNAGVDSGTDEFAKFTGLGKVEQGPFYTIPCLTSFTMIAGGMVIDTDGGVRHVQGGSIPRLYACGSSTTRQNPMEFDICGYTITRGFVFGRQAVEHMLTLPDWDAQA
jgi:hypothetical protein